MSLREYTMCDGCKVVVPVAPDDMPVMHPEWARVCVEGKEIDLCDECAEKALGAVGLGAGK